MLSRYLKCYQEIKSNEKFTNELTLWTSFKVYRKFKDEILVFEIK